MKVIFITGGSTGIGRACVEKFYKEGFNVAFLDINEEKANEIVASLDDKTRILFIKGSTRNKDDIQKAVETIEKNYGRLDCLFANAGIHQRNNILTITDEELETIVETNIYGTVNTIRKSLPLMIKSKATSIVINASDQVFIGKKNNFGYGLTKGALGQITKNLALDLGQYGIRVNAVCPSTIKTPLVDNLFNKFAKINNESANTYWQEENALFIRGSAGEPWEVAEFVYFLSSDKAQFCTGGHYLLDGGLCAG